MRRCANDNQRFIYIIATCKGRVKHPLHILRAEIHDPLSETQEEAWTKHPRNHNTEKTAGHRTQTDVGSWGVIHRTKTIAGTETGSKTIRAHKTTTTARRWTQASRWDRTAVALRSQSAPTKTSTITQTTSNNKRTRRCKGMLTLMRHVYRWLTRAIGPSSRTCISPQWWWTIRSHWKNASWIERSFQLCGMQREKAYNHDITMFTFCVMQRMLP